MESQSGRFVFIALILAVTLVFSGSAYAQKTTCEAALVNIAPGEKQIRKLRKEAESGVAKAQYELGCLYRWGTGTGKDFSQALQWFMKAADQDEPAARHEIADMYQHGGGKRQMQLVAAGLEQLAVEGDAKAQFSLAMMFMSGLGVDKDEAVAISWFEASARQGDINAKARLAGMYARGQGVEKDVDRAFVLGKEAADKGHVMAMLNIGRMYETGISVPKDIEKAKYYYRKAAEKGNRIAEMLLAILEKESPQTESSSTKR